MASKNVMGQKIDPIKVAGKVVVLGLGGFLAWKAAWFALSIVGAVAAVALPLAAVGGGGFLLYKHLQKRGGE